MKGPKNKSTLVLLLNDNQILLAMKKRGFGKGRWNGVGGKPENEESITQTAVRECKEEIMVTPQDLTLVAKLNFYFPAEKSNWNQQVHVFTSLKWKGEPTETEEMKPKWYKFNDIPYSLMWDDDKHWLPHVLEGKFVNASFTFDNKDQIVTKELSTSVI